MSRYIPKEIVLNNLEIPEGVSILYSIWTIKDKADGTIVHYTARDEVNLTSKIFTDVFEVGRKYEVIMSMVRTDGPTIDTRPLEVQVFAGDETYNLYPMPSVIDTPVITMAYALDNVPTNDIKFTGSNMIVAGNATHDYSNWWLTNDLNEVIWDSLKDQVNKTEIIVSGVDLKKDRFYTMHCVYIGTNRDSSGTGSITFRPNTFDELEIAGDLNNTYYGYGIDTRLKELNSDMTLFEYKLLGDDLELFSSSNTTGEIEINSYYAGEFIGIDLGNNTDKYIFAVKADNGMIYCIPYNASKVLKINPNTKETTLIGIDLGTGSAKYLRGVKANNGKIYCIPATAGKVLEIDPSTDTSILIGTDFGTTIDKHYHGVLHSNGKIYCPPYNANKVLEINPDTGVTTLIGTDYGASGIKYPYGVIGDNGKIYCAPYGPTVTQILEINVAGTTALIGASVGAVSGKYYTGLKANNGKIYFIPYSATKVVEIDTVALTATLIGNDLGATVGKYYIGVLASNGKIYSAPFNGTKVLLIDPNTSSTTLLNSSVSLNAGKYYSGNIAINGLLYFTSTSGVNTGQVIEINSSNNSINIINTPTNNGTSMYGISIFSDNILCFIPATTRNPFILDLTKYEDSKNSFLIESYSEYTLRLRITTNSSVIGWKDIKFKPKKFTVESDVWDDYDHVYENRVEVIDGKILNYDKSNYNTAFTTPNGKTYQLPNGEVILLRTKTKLGRFSINEDTGVMTHLGDLYLPQMTLNKDYNVFNFKIFKTGDVLIGVGYTDYTIYQFKYDPVNNRFIYKTKYTIPNGGSSTYSEMHLVESKVVFNTDGNNGSTQDVYVLDLVNQILELSIIDVVNGSIKGNLVRLDADDLIIRGGVSKSNAGTIVNSGKLLHIKNANGGVKLVGTDYGYLGLTQLYRYFVAGNNGKLYGIPYNASKVLEYDPITGISALIGSDLGATVGKYSHGILVSSTGMIYCAPANASQTLKINPNTGTTTLVGTAYGAGVNKYIESMVLADNDMIYCAPYDTAVTQVLKINPTNDTTSLIGASLGTGINKFSNGIKASNGKLYYTPNDAGQVLEVNPVTDTATLVGAVLPGTNAKYYKSILHPNGKIYFIPYNATKVLEFNPNTNTSTLIGSDLGATVGKYVIGAVASNGKIYAAPASTGKTLVIDPTAGTTSLIGVDLGNTVGKYNYTITGNSGKLYGIPLNANKVLEIDPNTDNANLINNDVSRGVAGEALYWTAINYNNKIYAAPHTTSRILEVDPSGFTIDTTADTRINLPSVGVSNESASQATLRNNELVLGNLGRLSLKSNSRDEIRYVGSDYGISGGWQYGILADNGMIYFMPNSATKVLKLDPNTGKTTLIGPDLGATNGKYQFGDKSNTNGKIYCAPFNATKVLEIDPATDTVSLIGADLGAGSKYTTTLAVDNGKLYGIPASATQVLEINSNTSGVALVGTTLATGFKYQHGVYVQTTGMIYCAPRTGATQVLKINTNNNTVSLIGMTISGTSEKYLYGILADNGMIYFPPQDASQVLRVDTTTDIVSYVGPDLGASPTKYSNITKADTGMLYSVPRGSISKVLKINPFTGDITLIGMDLTSVTDKYYGLTKADTGMLYSPPLNVGRILRIDPETDDVSYVGPDFGTAISKYYAFTKGVNNKLYSGSANTLRLLELDPAGLESNSFTLKKLPANKNTMIDTGSFNFKTNGGEDFKFTIFLNNGKRIFMSYNKDKPKLLIYK